MMIYIVAYVHTYYYLIFRLNGDVFEKYKKDIKKSYLRLFCGHLSQPNMIQ